MRTKICIHWWKSVSIRTLVYPQTTTHGVYNFVSTNYSCPEWIQVLKNGYIHGYTFMCIHINSFVYPLFGHKSVSKAQNVYPLPKIRDKFCIHLKIVYPSHKNRDIICIQRTNCVSMNNTMYPWVYPKGVSIWRIHFACFLDGYSMDTHMDTYIFPMDHPPPDDGYVNL